MGNEVSRTAALKRVFQKLDAGAYYWFIFPCLVIQYVPYAIY